jgi:hypothetical protein
VILTRIGVCSLVQVKFLGRDSQGISAVNPDEYAVRFQEMLTERLDGSELPELMPPDAGNCSPMRSQLHE